MVERILAAVVGLAIVVPVLIWGGQVGLEVVATIVLMIGLDEYVRMSVPGNSRARGFFLAIGSALFAVLVWGAAALTVPALAVATLLLLLFGLFSVPDTEKGVAIASRLGLGILYLPVLWSFLPAIRQFENGLAWVVLILVATWSGDTGAYFAGRAFGKNKLFPRVSPKKTWEGAIGGFVLAMAGAVLVAHLGLPEVSVFHALVLGAIVDSAGVVGDLAESLLKRAYGVKDSGTIMPGHGGILDRVDSLLFSVPAAWVYAALVGLA